MADTELFLVGGKVRRIDSYGDPDDFIYVTVVRPDGSSGEVAGRKDSLPSLAEACAGHYVLLADR